jgi:hypothetical protein
MTFVALSKLMLMRCRRRGILNYAGATKTAMSQGFSLTNYDGDMGKIPYILRLIFQLKVRVMEGKITTQVQEPADAVLHAVSYAHRQL